MGLGYESNFYCVTQNARQSPLYGTQEAVLEPLFGVGVLCPHDKKAVLVGDGKGTLEPGVVGGPGHLELQLALGGLPDSMSIHALYDPFWTGEKGHHPKIGREAFLPFGCFLPWLPRASPSWHGIGQVTSRP